MNEAPVARGSELAGKIARLVEEKGWNQEDFARATQLNRHTVRQILHGGPKRRLRNATVSHCAEALGLTVRDVDLVERMITVRFDANVASGLPWKFDSTPAGPLTPGSMHGEHTAEVFDELGIERRAK